LASLSLNERGDEQISFAFAAGNFPHGPPDQFNLNLYCFVFNCATPSSWTGLAVPSLSFLELLARIFFMRKQLTRFKYSVTRFGVRLAKDDGGAALVEYGLLVGLVAVVCIVGVTQLGANINDVFCAINTAISGVPALAAVGALPGC
jgi:pilus assembly protein Flp/PilA